MLQDDGMEQKSKMQTLMDLVQKMRELQGSSAKPHAMEVEIKAHKLDPADLEKMEEETHMDLDDDMEEGESPEHRAMVMGDESEDEESSEMELPEALKKLLMEKLSK